MKMSTRYLVQAAVIAALYTVTTLAFQPISFSHNFPFQLRISEMMAVLPAFFPAAIPGLFVGCLLANIIAGEILIAALAGSIATLISGFLSRWLRNYKWLVPLPPVLINAVIVGAYVQILYLPGVPMLTSMISVGGGQILSCYGLGSLLMLAIQKNRTVLARYMEVS